MNEGPVTSRKKPHVIRMAVFMLIGVYFGMIFGPAITGLLRGPVTTNDAGRVATEDALICAVAGSLAGIVVERLVRAAQHD
jgi:hypothetical protein